MRMEPIRSRHRLSAVAALAICGCHQTISLGDDLRSTVAAETSTGGIADAETSTGSSDGDGTSTASETSGSMGGGGESSTNPTTDGTGTTGSAAETTGGVCSPDPRDGECLSCVKTACCPETQSCNADPECDCMLECVTTPMPSSCAQTCEPNAAAAELATCIAMSCPADCN
jgi:hypothetical protein